MIGAGVFTTSGYSLQSLGSVPLVLLAWVTAGAVALCGARAYGELARLMPQSGGEYLYLSKRLHPFAGFLSGWISLTAGFSGAIALSAMTCEEYALPEAVRPAWLPPHGLASALVVICGLGHAFRQRHAAGLQNFIVIVKLVAIAAFILIGCSVLYSRGLRFSVPQDFSAAAAFSAATWGDRLSEFASSVMWISLSYAGFNQAIYIASEVRDPGVNIPRSLIRGTLLTTVIYVLLNLVFLYSAPAEQLTGKPQIAALAAAAIGGQTLEGLMRAVIVGATFSSVASMIMTGPRVYARMADDGVFPSYFSFRQGGIGRSVLLQTGLALMFIHVSTLYGLLQYLGTTLSLSSALTVFTLLRPSGVATGSSDQANLSRGQGDDERPVSTTGRTAAVCYVTATLVFAALMTFHNPRQLAGTGITLLAGGVLWLVLSAARRSRG